jgi:hypothetical protein
MYSRLAPLAIVSLLACSDGATEPTCDRCSELRIVTDRAEYRPGTMIAFTVTNRTSAVLSYDWCSVGLASRGGSGGFELRYSPSRRCGFGAGLEEVLEHMVPVAPGESVRDSILGSAVQSVYRVHVWLLDETGAPEPGNPVASNSFDMFPGAKTSVTR